MNRINLKRSDKIIARLLAVTFPEFRGRKIYGVVSDRPVRAQLFWDEGNKDDVCVVRLEDGAAVSMDTLAPWANDAKLVLNQGLPMQPGFAIVVLSHFGQNKSVTIHVAPEHSKFLEG